MHYLNNADYDKKFMSKLKVIHFIYFKSALI